MRIYLVTQDISLADSISRFLEFCTGYSVQTITYRAPESQTALLQSLSTICNSIAQRDSDGANSTDEGPLILIDPCFPFASSKMWENAVASSIADLDPLYVPTIRPDGSGEPYSPEPGQLFGLALLAYPDAHWVFLFKPAGIPDWNIIDPFQPHEWKSFFDLPSCRSAQLFDPKGLRDSIKASVPNRHGHPVRTRSKNVAAIDEEEPYVFLHGYLAYKLGRRVHLVTSEMMMRELFGNDGKNTPADMEMTFQDIFLNFPDHTGTEPQSDLSKRFKDYQGLDRINKHIFVSVGHKHSESYETNRAFFGDQRASGKTIKRVFKPSGGTYNVLRDAGLLREYWKNLREWIKKTAPPKKPEPERGSHSAPGRLVVIAESLNDRAEKILHEAQTVQECILGATLALEASELLGYRTPTTALESIALRHQLEVKAECMFYGVGYNIDVKNRLKEIEMEVQAVGRWFHQSVKRKSALNAQMSIITEIARIFRDYGQFDEEQACMRALRDLNRRWYFTQDTKHLLLSFFWPVRWYVEKLVGSFTLFVTMVFIWPLVFGISSWHLGAFFEPSWKIGSHIMNAYATFFGIQPVQFPLNPAAKILTLAIMVTGFVHLGIFIAHLYTLITRR